MNSNVTGCIVTENELYFNVHICIKLEYINFDWFNTISLQVTSIDNIILVKIFHNNQKMCITAIQCRFGLNTSRAALF